MENKKTKLTISGNPKKTVQNFTIDYPIIILSANFKIDSKNQLNKLIEQKIN